MSYTVKQIADALQVSKPTIRKHLKRLSDDDRAENFTDETGTLQLSEKCVNALCELLGVETRAETLPETPRKHGGNTGNGFSETFPETLEKQVETLENMVETMRKHEEQQEKHIEQLYRQLEVKDEQIKQLSLLISQQQAIHMAAIEAKPDELNEETNTAKVPEKERKQGFLSRLFRKNNN